MRYSTSANSNSKSKQAEVEIGRSRKIGQTQKTYWPNCVVCVLCCVVLCCVVLCCEDGFAAHLFGPRRAPPRCDMFFSFFTVKENPLCSNIALPLEDVTTSHKDMTAGFD